MKNVMVMLAVFGLVMGVILGCDDKDDPFQFPDGDIENNQVTYCEAIQPIFEASCTMCHNSALSGTNRNGATAGVNFDSYADAKVNATAANQKIQAGIMPPSGSLGAADKALFQAWVALQTPEGVCP